MRRERRGRLAGLMLGDLGPRRKELHRCPVQAMPLEGGRRTIRKDVAEVAVTTCTADLGTRHAMTAVFHALDVSIARRGAEFRIELPLEVEAAAG